MSDPLTPQDEFDWLQANPQFEERPASLAEFLGDEYLAIDDRVRARVRSALVQIMGEEVQPDNPSHVKRAIVVGGIGIGKQSRKGEPVLTPKGWIPIESLAVGDQVIGSDGCPTNVVGFFPQGVQPIWRVTFSDGAWTDVGPEHLWAVRRPNQSSYSVMSTAEIKESGLRRYPGADSWKWRIPIVEPVHFEGDHEPLPIAPYTLGVLIGDGCFTRRTVTLAGDDPEIGDRVASEVAHFDVTLNRQDRDWTIAGKCGEQNQFVAALENLGYAVGGANGDTSFTKLIPDSYMRGSPECRLEMLRGLMDADGGVMGNNSSSFSTSNAELARQVVEIVQSLGGTARMTEHDRAARPGSNTEYAVKVNLGEVCPFWLTRKKDAWKPRTNQKPVRSIVDISYVGNDEAFCIKVDAKDSLFVTRDYLVTHNTTIAAIVLTYLVHWTLCLRNPQKFFGLLDGSRIAFMMMSTSERQAKDVIFGDVKERIRYSPWFKKYPYDPTFKNRFEFPKHVVIIPGGSEDTQFEGYNVLGGVIDEIDSHKVTERKMYAQVGFETIVNRITSRYGDKGLICLIGQRKSQSGFAEMMYQDFLSRDDAYAENMTIWESRGDAYYADDVGTIRKFFYDVQRKQVIPPEVIQNNLIDRSSEQVLEIPMEYYDEFRRQPEKALKDLAGIPPAVGDPFISLTHKIHDARDRWVDYYGDEPPIDERGRIASWFKANDTLRRVGHLDIGFSGDGDALGFAMGHVREMVEIEGELKPYIVFDLLWQKTAPPGHEIFLGEVRHFIYALRHDLKFKLELVTMDGFESSDTMQQLPRRRIATDYLSVDKQLLPYFDLREAIYEDRVAFPPYRVYSTKDDTQLIEIGIQELTELVDAGKKVDHPATGSKDVADAMAGVTFTLMGDRRYHRKVTSLSQFKQRRAANDDLHPAYLGEPAWHGPRARPGSSLRGPGGSS